MLNLMQTPGPNLFGLAAVLHHDNLLDLEIAKKAVEEAKQQGVSVASYLVKTKILSSETILACCIKNFSLPVFDLKQYDFSWLDNSLINSELICRYHIIPLKQDKNFLQLGVSDPTDQSGFSAISFHTGLSIHPILIAEAELDAFINTYCRPRILYAQLENALSKMILVEEKSPQHERIEQKNEKDDEPVIEFVDKLLSDAIEKHISDIHLEPYTAHCRIRFRRDGLLYEAASTPLHLAARVITRLKIMANLNIAERRIPQDGHLQLKRFNKIDIRINTCPTLYGEKIVLRLLDTKNINLDIQLLGLLETQQQLFIKKISRPQGLILVTGPTGSGKTISLYSALHYLNQVEKNILTVEDPVEIDLPGMNQVTINPRIGLDFATVLRSFLRQDPDIIMIGEIRDKETGMIAMQAAETGHLVLATLHTNSAIETITRLQSMGIAFYHLINSISLIVAQRLVRKICHACREKKDGLEKFTAINPLLQKPKDEKNCQYCHQGYQGRIGIFECLDMTEEIAQLILSGANTLEITTYLKKSKWVSLWEAGLEKVKNQVTSYAELIRVLGMPRGLSFDKKEGLIQ